MDIETFALWSWCTTLQPVAENWSMQKSVTLIFVNRILQFASLEKETKCVWYRFPRVWVPFSKSIWIPFIPLNKDRIVITCSLQHSMAAGPECQPIPCPSLWKVWRTCKPYLFWSSQTGTSSPTPTLPSHALVSCRYAARSSRGVSWTRRCQHDSCLCMGRYGDKASGNPKISGNLSESSVAPIWENDEEMIKRLYGLAWFYHNSTITARRRPVGFLRPPQIYYSEVW